MKHWPPSPSTVTEGNQLERHHCYAVVPGASPKGGWVEGTAQMSKSRILLIEDDVPLSELLTYRLEREEFTVQHTANGEKGVVMAQQDPPDLVLLDWMLEELSGIEVCRLLRQSPATARLPIIMLSARGEEADRLRGLETGADDYVTKPFSPAELIARVRAVLRRQRPALAGATLSYGDVEMDLAAHKVRRSGTPVPFTPIEFRLLRHFLEHPGRVFSRERLMDAVWGPDADIEARTVDVHIRRLRQLLNEGGRPDLIRTVRAAGYSLDAGK